MRALLLGFTIFAATALPAAAQTMRCPVVGNEPRVEIALTSKKTALNTRTPLRELKKIAASSLGEHQALGLYLAKFAGGVEVSYDLRGQGDQVCVWITRVVVRLGYEDRTIYVAKEFEDGTCEYKAILSHEAKHAVTDDNVLAEYNGRFRKYVTEAVLANPMAGPARRHYLDDLKQELAESVQKAFRRTFDDFQAARDRAQKTVDTPEEYGRVKRICPGGFKYAG